LIRSAYDFVWLLKKLDFPRNCPIIRAKNGKTGKDATMLDIDNKEFSST
jgi:hypothetical protein